MTETIEGIGQEIDCSPKPEQIEVSVDEETGKLVEFHRDTLEKVA